MRRSPFLLLSVAVLAVAVAGTDDFTEFCTKGLFATTGMQERNTRCVKKILYAETRERAEQFCKSQRFAGKLQNFGADSFDCLFEHSTVCPHGFHMIQNQCYYFVKTAAGLRDALCAANKAKRLTHATKVMQSLFTVLANQQDLGHFWLLPHSARNEAILADNSTTVHILNTNERREYVAGQRSMVTHHRASFSPLPLVNGTTADSHYVICVAESSYTDRSLKKWCEMSNDHFGIPTVFESFTCFYLTYNHYATTMTQRTLIEDNKKLHSKCKMFWDKDYTPVDSVFLKSGKITSLLKEAHPVRLPGSADILTHSDDELSWGMYTSSGVKSTFDNKDWVRGAKGTRTPQLTALGGAYTLGLIRVSGQVKYTDIAPFTELPVLCAATLNAESSSIVSCNCPGTSVCVDGHCVCPAHTTDRAADFEYLDGTPAPVGRICYTCTMSYVFIVVIPTENCAFYMKEKLLDLLTTMFDKLLTGPDGDKYREIRVIGYGSRSSTFNVRASEGRNGMINKFNRDIKWAEKETNLFEAERLQQYYGRDTIFTNFHEASARENNGKAYAPLSEMNHPYLGIDQATDQFSDAARVNPDVKKFLIYYVHHPTQPEGLEREYQSNGWFFWTTNTFSVDFLNEQNWKRSTNGLLSQHPDVNIIGIHAPSGGRAGDDAFRRFSYKKQYKYQMDNTGRSHPDYDDIVNGIDELLCTPSTAYATMDKFRMKANRA